ncbi:MAG: LL-diaminopimelate aminotransferase [Clostridia bacterium]|nr:LL-diaminopimelate aminotransferase [Clostridia bacterium]
MKYNEALKKLSESYLFSGITAKVNEMKREGKAPIDLGVGDVKFPLYCGAKDAMKKASEEMGEKGGYRGYMPFNGLFSLREKIAKSYLEMGVNIAESEVFISDGAKSDLYRLFTLFGRGAEILIPTPCYPAYAEQAIISGGNVTNLRKREEDGFIPRPPYGKKFDVIVLCSPDNPTGSVMGYSHLREWVDYAISIGAVIIFDGAYDIFISGDNPRSIYEIRCAEKCAVEVRSFSKCFGFTGVRCGYSVIPHALGNYNATFSRILGATFNGVSYITQMGAESYFTEGGKKWAEERATYYKDNAEILKMALNGIGLKSVSPSFSPYVFAKVPEKYDDVEFCEMLLEKAGIVATPGSGFGDGGEGYIRLAAFEDRKKIFEAADKISCLKDLL